MPHILPSSLPLHCLNTLPCTSQNCRWNPYNLSEVGASSATGGGISNNSGSSMSPSMAITPDSIPYVAWLDNSSDPFSREIYVRRWNGSSWEEVGTGSASGGGISNNSGQSSSPSLTIAPNGTPYVAWNDESGGPPSEIYVRCWGKLYYLPIILKNHRLL